jgi:hypothetical protein
MKIVIFDCRLVMTGAEHSLRANDLQSYLKAGGYEVTCRAYTNFENHIDILWTDEEAAIRERVAPYDVIVLHVGGDQTLAKKSLSEAYQGKYVVCFSGGGIPTECQQDCLQNTRHCYIKEDIGTADTWPELWKTRILEYIRLLEQGKPEDAWNLIMEYDPDLEEALDTLSGEFSDFLDKNETPTDEQLKEFAIIKRDKAFSEWAKKKAERERANQP